eukprot:m.182064 g.182064  ORF g.182064 m.182064 type:complete len:844 (+) comp32094_c0_seq1:227-2758(+)
MDAPPIPGRNSVIRDDPFQEVKFAKPFSSEEGARALERHFGCEIQALACLRDFLVKRTKVEKDHANQMRNLCKGFKSSFDSAKPAITSHIVESVSSFYDEYDTQANLEQERLKQLELTLLDLTKLIDSKTDFKNRYVKQRTAIAADLLAAKDYSKYCKSAYDKACKDLKKSEKKGSRKSSGKKGTKADRDQEDKLRQMKVTHNKYVLSLKEYEVHAKVYKKLVLPTTLDSAETFAKFLSKDIKLLLQQILRDVDVTNDEYQKVFTSIKDTITEINPDTEYDALCEDCLQEGDYEDADVDFEFVVADEQKDSTFVAIREGEIEVEGVDEDLENLAMDAEIAVKDCEEKAKEEDEETNKTTGGTTLNNELDNVDERADELKKFMDIRERVQQKAKYECDGKKQEMKAATIRTALGAVKDNTTAISETHSTDAHALANRPSPPLPNSAPPPTFSGFDNEDGVVDDGSMEANEWFHGVLARAKVSELLQRRGDFLVRESANKVGKLVLSVFVDPSRPHPISHFPLNPDNGMFSFEGDAFPTVRELLDYHLQTKEVITQKSLASIERPAKRSERPFTHDDVTKLKRLGKGNFGDVYEGLILKTNTRCAIKTCRANAGNAERFLEEADTLNQYKHPNIVQIHGVIKREPIWILLELCEGGELLQYLRKKDVVVSVSEKCNWAYEAASGIAYLHTKNCIHRDLAARNCLLTGDDPMLLKISDFGMSRVAVDDEDLYTANTSARQIPIRWTAPEALEHLEYYTSTDVWGYGIMIWEIFSGGKLPYAGFNNSQTRHEVTKNGYRLECPSDCPEQVYGIMSRCWQHDKTDRPTMSQIESDIAQINSEFKDQDL